ncbi:hypothetical protein C1H76_5709 [Elsinoe australis]|uniref:lytic cellulose monooxygenase (C4-dehydrogenating) n=1 Tax=Elsinoe australis TaxID=40998 RepID=A0A4U7B048_9PEZI|nr:hypothetical protein C1H76_5709 [Elsinoe australis]
MHASISLAALAALVPFVAAHGHLTNVNAGGKDYPLMGPDWVYKPAGTSSGASWRGGNQDNGFVGSSAAELASGAVSCHKRPTKDGVTGTAADGALPADGAPVPVTAGSTLTVTWDQWPTHPGPTLDYLAKCPGKCADLKDASQLQWFKIRESGIVSPGKFEASTMSGANVKQQVKIPAALANGEYVLRHEIIALHGSTQIGGAQLYPQCFNVAVSGGGSLQPAGVTGDKLYTERDPGIYVPNYWSADALANYDIPGPAIDPALRGQVNYFTA